MNGLNFKFEISKHPTPADWRQQPRLSIANCRTWLFVVVAIACLPGCVHRRLTVNSNPPGARVLLDGEEVGETPTSVDFTHYGRREIVLQKDGYETLKTLQRVRTPWYQRIPLDFFSDNLIGVQLTNRHEFSYQMQPAATIVPTQELLGRANSLRSEAHAGP